MTDRPLQTGFTGRHMLAIMIAFFTVVIAVNVTMATVAGTSWTGFVVRNSYVASQEFNGKVAAARAQDRLGWTASLTVQDGVSRLAVADRQGQPVMLASASLVLRSPASDRLDRTITLDRAGGAFTAPLDVGDGQWVVEIDAQAADGALWRDTRRVVLAGGSMR